MMSEKQSETTRYWGKPAKARRWHIFAGSRSLCSKWMYGGATEEVDPEEDTHRDGDDCKRCCRKAGVLSDE